MKKPIFLYLMFFLLCSSFRQPRIVSDCTVNYAITGTADTDLGSRKMYLKGRELRLDVNTSLFNEIVFFDGNSGSATIIKEVGDSKYIKKYTPEEWKRENEIYVGAKTSLTGRTKKILNYECKEAIITQKNGSSSTVFYTPDIIPSIKESLIKYKDVPGLILEYEAEIGQNKRVTYTATKVDFNPVPSIQFEIPKSGNYRILN